jgi:hypothetical protein
MRILILRSQSQCPVNIESPRQHGLVRSEGEHVRLSKSDLGDVVDTLQLGRKVNMDARLET